MGTRQLRRPQDPDRSTLVARIGLLSALAATFVVLAGLTACGGPSVFPPPLGLGGAADYAERVPSDYQDTTATVLYATDRAPREDATPKARYTAGRGFVLRLGTATVAFGGESQDWDSVATATADGRSVPLRITALDEFGVLPETTLRRLGDTAPPPADGSDAFVQAVNERLAAADTRTITVYVHGFNTTFTSGIHVSASLWHLQGRRDLVIPFSWPAHGHPFQYGPDRESAGLRARALREFLSLLAQRTDAERINLLSYSAGAPLAVETLHQLRLIFADEEPDEIQAVTKLHEVVFAGADVDPDSLHILGQDRVQDVAERVTIYTSRLDRGLVLSSLFYFNSPRLGRAERGLTDEQRAALRDYAVTQVIDVTRAQRRAGGGDTFAHGYWNGNRWISNDLMRLLRTGDEPEARGLVRDGDSGVWTFPEDYPERAIRP